MNKQYCILEITDTLDNTIRIIFDYALIKNKRIPLVKKLQLVKMLTPVEYDSLNRMEREFFKLWSASLKDEVIEDELNEANLPNGEDKGL